MAEIRMHNAGKASDLNLKDDFANPEYSEWVESVKELLKGKPFEKAMLTETYEGITLNPIYTQKDVEDLLTKLQFPGNDDYVRHTKPSGYLGRSWEIAQEQTAYSPVKANKMTKHELARGVTKVRIRLDRQSKSGKDPNKLNHTYYYRGTSVANMKDIESLFEGIDFTDTALDFDSGIMAPAYFALINAQLDEQMTNLTGTISFDPLWELEETGELHYALPRLYDLMRAMVRWTEKNNSPVKVISINTRTYHDSGCSAVQELGYAFAKAVEYVRQMLDRGINIDEIAKRIQFNLFIGSDFFMEIAKFRAARLIWSNIMEAFGASENSRKMFIHASTGHFNKTKYDPYVNILRTTTEGFAAVLGSVNSLHLGFFDQITRRPDEFSRRIARNQQIILKEEAALNKVIDPAGGSWYIEKLTAEIADKAWETFQDIEKNGGILESLKSGLIQTAIGKVSASKKKNADIRKDVKVGTNMYANLTEEVLENRDNDVRRQVQARILEIEDFKSDRDPSIKDALKSIELDPKCSCSIDKLTELWKNGATISEISRIVYPIEETITIPVFNQKRAVQHFEELRAAVEAMKPSPEVFFANMGPIAQHKARADFSRGFFEVAGLKIINSDGLACENCFAREYKEKKSPIVVICSTDETYPELVPAITAKAKGINPEVKIVVAGYPKEYIESFTACGVNEFIHIKADAYEVLKRLVESVGGAV